jgi:hypothetical protein
VGLFVEVTTLKSQVARDWSVIFREPREQEFPTTVSITGETMAPISVSAAFEGFGELIVLAVKSETMKRSRNVVPPRITLFNRPPPHGGCCIFYNRVCCVCVETFHRNIIT